MSTLSAQAYTAISDYFFRVSGIRLTAAKQALVQGRLYRLAADNGYQDLDRFIQDLVRKQLPAALEVATVDRLTTNETYFYREPAHFEHLRRQIAAHPRGQELCVWSAASSTGEEAYSVAMVLADLLGSAPWRVMGTDLSTTVVQTARQGLYAMDRADNIPEDYLKRFCLRGTGPYEGTLLIERSVRSRVEFLVANLMRELPALPAFDVIFLRNVLIYFEPDHKADIVRRVLQRLKPGGLLYVGHAESLNGLNLPLRTVTTAVYAHA